MKRYIPAFCLLALMGFSSVSSAATQWYVGYTFIYNESGNACSFMRFRVDSHAVEQADVIYSLFADQLSNYAKQDSTFSHTLPSEALAKGETGEQMGAAFVSKGVGACLVADEPVEGVLFISSFHCEYQDEPQMCIRQYVDTGARDLTNQGIARGPAVVGGDFVRREVWDASSGLVFAGALEVPYAVDSVLRRSAAALSLVTD